MVFDGWSIREANRNLSSSNKTFVFFHFKPVNEFIEFRAQFRKVCGMVHHSCELTISLPPATLFRLGNVFIPVCDSVHRGVSDRHLSLGRPPPPPDRHALPRKRPLQRTVRILLECILVFSIFVGPPWQLLSAAEVRTSLRKLSDAFFITQDKARK